MPRYFFDTDRLHDDEGVELANDDVAREEARLAAGAMLIEEGLGVWTNNSWKLRVRSKLATYSPS